MDLVAVLRYLLDLCMQWAEKVLRYFAGGDFGTFKSRSGSYALSACHHKGTFSERTMPVSAALPKTASSDRICTWTDGRKTSIENASNAYQETVLAHNIAALHVTVDDIGAESGSSELSEDEG
ncbi:hypothetical protein DOTSEDRAFT_29737 [Dothistroma septosporum NZE10]|uniref:Uncharacterized protein n=1 Tax=Dothistroma septosporum (strain NZE10 / CBS 128990) TaxID=675120 RepID=M2YHZ4_DOTSN|nr:hypothetical protein DOTSEDRAFT_29737 [Dothistroma septosporum NZE10]